MLLAGASKTSDCVSTEKREGTLGLLFLTNLRGYDVVLGKLVSCSLATFYQLAATFPVVSLVLLLGGVTLPEIGRMALLCLNTLFFAMAAGVCVSTLSRDDRWAMFGAASLIAIVAATPYLPLSDSLLPASPVFAFRLLTVRVFNPTFPNDFYTSVLITHLLGWGFLLIASLTIPRVCRERPPSPARQRWHSYRNSWIYGTAEGRRRLRTRLVDRNPFYWLASRDQVKAKYVWAFTISMVLLWVWAGWLIQSFRFDWDVSLSVMFLAFALLKVWMASEVCTRWIEDYSPGALELLLTTPQSARTLVRGQFLALLRQFGWPVLVLLALTGWLLTSALRAPHYGIPSRDIVVLYSALAILLVADGLTLQWVGMWQSLAHRHLNRAALGTGIRVLFLPGLIAALVGGSFAVGASWGLGGLIWLGVGFGSNLFLMWHARHQLWRRLQDPQAALPTTLPPANREASRMPLGPWLGHRLPPRPRRARIRLPWLRRLMLGLAVVHCRTRKGWVQGSMRQML